MVVDSGLDLSFHGVYKFYELAGRRVLALRDVNGVFRSGLIHLVMGPSGSGKTTLAKVIMGLESPTAGEVLVNGEDVLSFLGGSDDGRRVRYASQFPGVNLFADLTVGQNLLLFACFHGLDASRLFEFARSNGLGAVLGTRVRSISFGESMRLLLSLYFFVPPLVLLLDEPTAQLDGGNVSRVKELLLQLKDSGRVVIVFSHDFRLLEVADVLHVLRDGSLLFSLDLDVEERSRLVYSNLTVLRSFFDAIPLDDVSGLGGGFEGGSADDSVVRFLSSISEKGETRLPLPVFRYYDFRDGKVFFEFDERLQRYFIANPVVRGGFEGGFEDLESSSVRVVLREVTRRVLDESTSLVGDVVFRFCDARKVFRSPRRVLFDGLSFEVRSHEFVVIVGPSGSGKSTILSLIAGLEELSGGSVEWGEGGVPLFSLVSQENNFVPFYTMRENLLFWSQESWDSVSSSLGSYLEVLGLVDLLDKYPSQLSGGELKRFSVLVGLSRRPSLLLLDEPTANLNHVLALQLLRVLFEYYLEHPECTIVLVTHDLKYIPPFARVLELQDKCVVEVENRVTLDDFI